MRILSAKVMDRSFALRSSLCVRWRQRAARKARSKTALLIPKPQHDKFPASTLVLYRLYRTSPSKSCYSERVPQNERTEETATPESCRLYSCGLFRGCRMRREVVHIKRHVFAEPRARGAPSPRPPQRQNHFLQT